MFMFSTCFLKQALNEQISGNLSLNFRLSDFRPLKSPLESLIEKDEKRDQKGD